VTPDDVICGTSGAEQLGVKYFTVIDTRGALCKPHKIFSLSFPDTILLWQLFLIPFPMFFPSSYQKFNSILKAKHVVELTQNTD